MGPEGPHRLPVTTVFSNSDNFLLLLEVGVNSCEIQNLATEVCICERETLCLFAAHEHCTTVDAGNMQVVMQPVLYYYQETAIVDLAILQNGFLCPANSQQQRLFVCALNADIVVLVVIQFEMYHDDSPTPVHKEVGIGWDKYLRHICNMYLKIIAIG